MGYISKSLGFLNSYSFLTIIFHILDFGYLFSIYYILNLSRLIFSVSMFFISCILWFCYYSLSIHGYILLLFLMVFFSVWRILIHYMFILIIWISINFNIFIFGSFIFFCIISMGL